MFAPPRPTTSMDALHLNGIAGSNYAQATALAGVAFSGSYTSLANLPPATTLDAATAAGNATTNSATFGDLTAGAYAVPDGNPNDGIQSDGSFVVAAQTVIGPDGSLYLGGNIIQPFAADASISSDGAGTLTVTALNATAVNIQGNIVNSLAIDPYLSSDGAGNLAAGTINANRSSLWWYVTADPVFLIPSAVFSGYSYGAYLETSFVGPLLSLNANSATNLTGLITLLCPNVQSGTNFIGSAVLYLDAACGMKATTSKPVTWYVQSTCYAVTWGHGTGQSGVPLSITQLSNVTAGANVAILQAAVATNSTGLSLQMTSHTTSQLPVQWTLGIKFIGQSY